jgi:hypothetical protein
MTAPRAHDRPAPKTGGSRGAGPVRWFLHGGWYVFVIVLSLGMLSFVPFLHAALRLRRPLPWLWVGLYTAAVVALFQLTNRTYAGGLIAGLMVVASVHAIVLRRSVWSPAAEPAPGTATADGSVDPAVAAVLAARSRRAEARRLAAADPQMARELRIGRPDLPRAYDDGGLVDLGSAPAQVIARSCDIPLDHATAITRAREGGIAFTGVDDVLTLVDLPYPLWDRIRDRAIVVPG